MRHILTECTVAGQAEVWALASQIWEKKSDAVGVHEPLEVSLGGILSCGVQPEKARKEPGGRWTERFRRMVMIEAAHLIWKLRNDRVINEKAPPTMDEIGARWNLAMNRRLRLDCLLCDKKKFGKMALSKAAVLGTWSGTLVQEALFPRDWTESSGVLVGRSVGSMTVGHDYDPP